MNLEFIGALLVGFSIGWLFVGYIILYIAQGKRSSNKRKEYETLVTELGPQELEQIARENVIVAASKAPFEARLDAVIKVLEFEIEYVETVMRLGSEEDFSEKEAELIFEISRFVSVLSSELDVLKNHQLDFELKKFSDR